MSAKGKMRLDQLLVTRNLTQSRQKAQALIMAGQVKVGQMIVIKPATMIEIETPLEILQNLRYVSRGGQKLEKALTFFNIQVRDKICLDVGASTGGFTDCLLQHGAKKVYAVDVGKGQLDYKLQQDQRVVNMEKTNIRYVERSNFSEPLELAVIDVSFISLDKVLPKVKELLKECGQIIALIKPQFEAGPKHVSKGGVVRDEKIQRQVIEKIELFAQIMVMEVKGVVESPLLGPAGNKEFLIYLVKS